MCVGMMIDVADGVTGTSVPAKGELRPRTVCARVWQGYASKVLAGEGLWEGWSVRVGIVGAVAVVCRCCLSFGVVVHL
jgi:hypothetical protein